MPESVQTNKIILWTLTLGICKKRSLIDSKRQPSLTLDFLSLHRIYPKLQISGEKTASIASCVIIETVNVIIPRQLQQLVLKRRIIAL